MLLAKKKKFRDEWGNQTKLGKIFGFSAIKVGKILVEHNLKMPNTKEATQKALNEGYAKFTPLKDGTSHYMWNIKKVQELISQQYKPLDQVDYWVNEVKKVLQDADELFKKGEDKQACLLCDFAYDEVPKSIVADVTLRIENDNYSERKQFFDM